MRTVILAAGDFPKRGGEPHRLLAAADVVVACDSAAAEFRRRFRRWPDAIVGDLDSLPSDVRAAAAKATEVVRDGDADTNDLDKAVRFCRARALGDPVVLGATGKREDHAIGNVYRCLDLGLRIVTEEGEFLPVSGTRRFRTWRDAGVSVFASDVRTRMTSRGLKWKLDGVRFANPYCATLNRASAENVVVTSDRPALVFVARNPRAVRAVVSLGSNLGNRAAFLRRALRAMAAFPETRLVDASTVIETEGVDVPDEFRTLRFLNQVALFETTLAPLAFSRAMHAVEDRLGRVRTVRNGPRTIDLDLISFGDVRMRTPELTLPHPRARARSFVTEPLRSLGLEVG